MKTVGQLLQIARKQKGLELLDISKETNIKLVHLQAIEADDYESLPAATFTKGFIRNYAIEVGLSPDKVLALFRRDFDQNKKGKVVPRALLHTENRFATWLTPATSAMLFSVLIISVITSFFIYQFLVYWSNPRLEIAYPLANEQVQNPVEVQGITDPQVRVSISGQVVAVDENGQFYTEVQLPLGQQTLSVTAFSRSGKETTVSIPLTILSP